MRIYLYIGYRRMHWAVWVWAAYKIFFEVLESENLFLLLSAASHLSLPTSAAVLNSKSACFFFPQFLFLCLFLHEAKKKQFIFISTIPTFYLREKKKNGSAQSGVQKKQAPRDSHCLPPKTTQRHTVNHLCF